MPCNEHINCSDCPSCGGDMFYQARPSRIPRFARGPSCAWMPLSTLVDAVRIIARETLGEHRQFNAEKSSMFNLWNGSILVLFLGIGD